MRDEQSRFVTMRQRKVKDKWRGEGFRGWTRYMTPVHDECRTERGSASTREEEAMHDGSWDLC
jgi:hypothetical protein